MSLDAPPVQNTSATNQRPTNAPKLIADYSDFKAWSLNLAPGAELVIPAQQYYALAIGISGITQVGDLGLAAEDACFIPALALPCTIRNNTNANAQIILGGPPALNLSNAVAPRT